MNNQQLTGGAGAGGFGVEVTPCPPPVFQRVWGHWGHSQPLERSRGTVPCFSPAAGGQWGRREQPQGRGSQRIRGFGMRSPSAAEVLWMGEEGFGNSQLGIPLSAASNPRNSGPAALQDPLGVDGWTDG